MGEIASGQKNGQKASRLHNNTVGGGQLSVTDSALLRWVVMEDRCLSQQLEVTRTSTLPSRPSTLRNQEIDSPFPAPRRPTSNYPVDFSAKFHKPKFRRCVEKYESSRDRLTFFSFFFSPQFSVFVASASADTRHIRILSKQN